MLSVLADLGRVRSVQVARALGLEASTITRLADRLVAAGHVARGCEEGHRSVVTLELSPSGRDIVSRVAARREQELSRISAHLSACDRDRLSAALCQLVEAAGEGYGAVPGGQVPR
jgi:DNA-binding MarR family transcriptional regulator